MESHENLESVKAWNMAIDAVLEKLRDVVYEPSLPSQLLALKKPVC